MTDEGHPQDRAVTALALALLAAALGYAININLGDYARWAMVWLSISVALGIAAICWPAWPQLEHLSRRVLPLILAIAIAIQSYHLLRETNVDPRINLALAVIAILGLAQFYPLRGLRLPLMVIVAGAFFLASRMVFMRYNPAIDVYMFQETGCWALMHGFNPYTFHYPSIYPLGTPFYGPGVVGAQGILTVGFPYPPLSLLLVLPAYLAVGDVRYAMAIAMGVSAILMAAARPGRVAALAAALFLLTPRAIYVENLSWTEPLLVLAFSLTMLCALYRPKALPWVFGLYLCTKQYAVLAVPLLPLLLDRPHLWKSFWDLIVKAALVAAVINLPFFAWNPHAFFRSTVEFQFLQPFRRDALSYLVFIFHRSGGLKLPIWVSAPPLAIAIAVCLWRAPRTPAGFAAAVAVTHMIFFAFNKQAFCNYYYFVIAVACWSIAAAGIALPSRQTSPGWRMPARAPLPEVR